ncbi:methyl-accepting chemotaxis protein [Natrarchaeobius sp. A-rgal3]|uniref:methyl-accepting chemotaxis protein n=1 Tax=Natrarchaeobius versutus TaxID=1679078 RepID=UPI00351080B2
MSNERREPIHDDEPADEPSDVLSTHTTHPREYTFSYEEIQQILEAVQHWIWVKNRDGEYVLVNEKQAREAYDLSSEEIRGTTDYDQVLSNTRAGEEADLEEEQFRADDLEVMDTGRKKEIPQERITTADGAERVLRTVKSPFETEITDQDATIGIAEDITNRLHTDKLVGVHEATHDLLSVQSIDEIGEIAVRTSTTVIEQEYCTVWVPDESADRLRLHSCSDAVEANTTVRDPTSITAGPGDVQWERFVSQQSAVETNVREDIDPADLPVDRPLTSHILLPIGEYGLLEIGSFDRVLFKDDLAKILAANLEAAFGRLERERNLRDVTGEVDATVAEVDESTTEVAEMSTSVTDRADQQAATMEHVLDGVTRMNSAVEEIAATADEVETTSSRAEALSEEGKSSAEDAKRVIDDVTGSAESVADDVDRLQERVNEIDEIVEVINDVADQTNILALNASIEAARANEKGKGFSVVANEVKTLAEETQEHANEIERVVDDVQNETDETVENLSEMVDRIENGNELVERAVDAFVDVADAIADASTGIGEVATATDEQAASAEEIASQAERATELANEVATEADRIATANDEIATQVADLQSAVADLAETE